MLVIAALFGLLSLVLIGLAIERAIAVGGAEQSFDSAVDCTDADPTNRHCVAQMSAAASQIWRGRKRRNLYVELTILPLIAAGICLALHRREKRNHAANQLAED